MKRSRIQRKTPLKRTRKDGAVQAKPIRRKRKPKSARDKCDDIFSKFIRLRDRRCQKCGTEKNLQCSHIISKGVSPTVLRCDFENAIALCVACHLYWWHKEPLAAAEWFKAKWPGRYEALLEKDNSADQNRKDWNAEYRSIEEAYRSLCAERGR